MNNEQKLMNKNDIIFSLITSIVVLVVGLILLQLGYNEAFYIENSTIRTIFSILTQIGSELAYIALLALVFFAINKKYGRTLLIGFMINVFFNGLVKDIVKDPRPSTNIVDGEPIETSYGFPSGHTQNAVGFWGYALFYTKNRGEKKTINTFIIIMSIFWLVILPISRLIIGVHDLQDIIGGFVIGMVILITYMALIPRFEQLKTKKISIKIIVGFLAAFIFWLTFCLIIPEAAEGLGQAGGILMAGAICFPLEETYVQYEPEKLSTIKRILAGIIGLLITMGVYFGLSLAFGGLTTYLWIWRCVRYFLLGIVVIIVVPLILKKTLAK